MNPCLRLVLLAVFLALGACSTPPPRPSPEAPAVATPPSTQLEFALKSGTYQCELKVRIQVEREIRQGTNTGLTLVWNGNRYRLERDPSYSGLPRFEDAARSLVWIDLPWKSLLLDGKTNKPLINECRPG